MNVNVRPFYAEGAKTAAFEIVEQLEWDSPDHIIPGHDPDVFVRFPTPGDGVAKIE